MSEWKNHPILWEKKNKKNTTEKNLFCNFRCFFKSLVQENFYRRTRVAKSGSRLKSSRP